jgi:hypothetical protein
VHKAANSLKRHQKSLYSGRCSETGPKNVLIEKVWRARVNVRGRKMPIWTPVESEPSTFGPDTIAVLATAFEDTLHYLRLLDRSDPAVTIVAKRIIELARQGERDLIRLRDDAIQSFR